jgi:hypothetical protein
MIQLYLKRQTLRKNIYLFTFFICKIDAVTDSEDEESLRAVIDPNNSVRLKKGLKDLP